MQTLTRQTCAVLVYLSRCILCFFFFSSRRRHTRSDRDWSSDVCSSDLPEHLITCVFYSIYSIYLEYCNKKVLFKYNYLPYLQLANNGEIIKPFFDKIGRASCRERV